MRRRALLGILATTAIGCGGAAAGAGDDAGAAPGGAGELSDEEVDGLVFSREEEKVARDVYARLASFDPAFSNIGESEQRHMDAIGGLLERYGIDDPATGKGPGEFSSPELAALYADLVRRGEVSREAALRVAVEIEELDIRDLDDLMADTSRSDLLQVYENLQRGSRNHLRTYHAKLTAAGEQYVPQFLSRETFDAIVSSAKERGGR